MRDYRIIADDFTFQVRAINDLFAWNEALRMHPELKGTDFQIVEII